MEPGLLEALKESIEYWQNIVDVKDYPRGSTGCPLCIYVKKISTGRLDCTKCPVYTVSQQLVCRNTPYHIAGGILMDIEETAKVVMPSLRLIEDAPNELKEAYLAACRKELEFLQSLLPGGGEN